ncbi:hypothetical protein [Parasitella parasitica]|uniref:Uncharacterized protein n=1 Tax=Parasitella parasitica TaxID=35722 RepID=A0A0B7NX35_9FUNG|nr:hypothetical protein [Parasitella parasitica]
MLQPSVTSAPALQLKLFPTSSSPALQNYGYGERCSTITSTLPIFQMRLFSTPYNNCFIANLFLKSEIPLSSSLTSLSINYLHALWLPFGRLTGAGILTEYLLSRRT